MIGLANGSQHASRRSGPAPRGPPKAATGVDAASIFESLVGTAPSASARREDGAPSDRALSASTFCFFATIGQVAACRLHAVAQMLHAVCMPPSTEHPRTGTNPISGNRLIAGLFVPVRWRSVLVSQSGRPDLNRGPHRPERCALPGCATPRLRRLSQSLVEGGGAAAYAALRIGRAGASASERKAPSAPCIGHVGRSGVTGPRSGRSRNRLGSSGHRGPQTRR